MQKAKILCIDDNPNVLTALRRTLEPHSFDVLTAASCFDALSILEKEMCDVALVDYKMPEMNGIELIREMKQRGYDIESIIVTAFGDVHLVVQAMKVGAYDYILKPWDEELLLSSIDRVLEYKYLKKERDELQYKLRETYIYKNLIGSSVVMRRIFKVIDKVKDSDANVLIYGESGTGKEEIAKAIHYCGKRKEKLFIPVDCTSINPNVIESELFGHVRGAFTGAHQMKEGLMKSAGKGTIFLDEIAEIPMHIQAKLLRAIQEMAIKPVGSNKTEKIEARIIAATNKDLQKAIKNKEFREDLYYRLNVISIEVPPLRDHKEDIPELVGHFIEKYNTDEREIQGITKEALEKLMEYSWPGNIRELENCIERTFTLGTGEYIESKDLPRDILSHKIEKKDEIKTLGEIEREHIIKTILNFKGNKRQAAKALGIGKSTLYNKLKEYNIDL